ncbi:Minor extracellular protease vpr [Colletotrichum orbiculare MAFF 240422]|uniref:Minor extracellular protease vpr n=1 Tax=Colletotrichum orbiculare (strain 104-T / ATCC 96160 / CBS 514.97 / LARS 414 / MAFF 240422) TaxID=1213857 RepID=N4VM44_COLOR|nr:Minor extracellular protease vpr [Colletotrichum orbiculare MAFF 240422]
MRLVTRFTATAACCLALVASQAVPKSYFVQLSKEAAAADGSNVSPETLVDRAADLSIPVRVRFQYTDKSIFYGASVSLDNDGDAEKLRALPGVESVVPVQRVEHPLRPSQPSRAADEMGTGPPTTNSDTRKLRSRALGPRAAEMDWNTPHIMTGVDRVHAKGVRSEGVRVAVIDTGIDYKHPALGGCFGKGCKVGFGYDLVGDGYGGVTGYDTVPSPDPRPGCYDGFHGTHVAGIIGMDVPSNSSTFAGLVGVAPGATLGMYRVFGCSGYTSDDAIVAAMQRAVEDGADVVSISIGGFGTWSGYPNTPVPAAAAALKAKGIAVIAAGGNSGTLGMFSINLPGGADGALGVASVENSKFPTYPVRDSNGAELRYGALYPFPEGEYPVVWAGSNTSKYNYGCSASDYPAAGSLAGPISEYIVAVRRGPSCSPTQVRDRAAAANFTRVITYPDPTIEDVFIKGHAVPTPSLAADGSVFPQGSILDDAFSEAAGSPASYKLLVESQTPLLVDQPGGGSPNNFSSIGPNADFAFKPQIAAPGGMILATFPLMEKSGGFGIMSGTSMATPYIAGVYALIKSQHPSLSVDEIFQLMQTTATQVKMADHDVVAPAIQQGAGLVQVYDAIFSKSVVQPGEIKLVDVREAAISIDNPSDVEVTYNLAHHAASGAAPFSTTGVRTPEVEYIPQPFEAQVTFPDGDEVTIPAGASRNVSFTVAVPADLDANTVPVFSGFIGITSSRNETFSVPYAGPAYNYSSSPVVGLAPLTPEQRANASSPSRDPLSAPQVFGNGDKRDIGDYRAFSFRYPDYPVALFTPLQPLRRFRFDVVRASTNFTPTWYGFDPAAELANLTETAMPDNGTVAGVPILGSVEVLQGWLPRTDYEASWSYSILDVTATRGLGLSKGSYRILLRWLRFYADEEDPAAWESWMSGVVDVLEDVFEPTPPS